MGEIMYLGFALNNPRKQTRSGGDWWHKIDKILVILRVNDGVVGILYIILYISNIFITKILSVSWERKEALDFSHHWKTAIM